MIYFLLIKSFVGQVYFRVSKHLSIPISQVIREKFHPDMKLLIMFYSEEIRQEQREIQKIKEQTGEMN